MKIGIQLGYWGRTPPADLAQTLADVDDLGLDSVWVAESWGNDAFTYAAWVAAHTKRVRIGTGIVQMAARTPDRHGDGGHHGGPPLRRPLHPGARGIGPAGGRGLVRPAEPAAARPHPRVRRDHPAHAAPRGEADLRRRVLPAAVHRPGQRRARQAAELMVHPLRADLPIVLGAEGPEERHPDRRDRRRLAAAVLLAVPARGVRRPARGRQARLRDPGARQHQRHRRRRSRPGSSR